MAITSEQVRNLREKTGAGMMDCKRALEESGGDLEKAIEYLRKKGAATAQKRADKLATEGIIVTRVSQQGKFGVIVEVNCETDFVARSEDFVGFANVVADVIEKHSPKTLDELSALPSPNGKKISDAMNELLTKVGEKIDIRRFEILKSTDGLIGGYTHMGSKIGVIVELGGLNGDQEGAVMSRDVAMQVAAMNPQFVRRDDVPKVIIDRELEIYKTQARNEGKPDQILERIANGKLEKFYQEMCLVEQSFIKDAGKTIKDMLGSNTTVRRFQRFHLGDLQ